MATNKNFKKSKKEIKLRKKGGIPNWVYMTLSFLIPPYGLIYYILLKDKDKRTKIALFFAFLGFMIWLVLKVVIWSK